MGFMAALSNYVLALILVKRKKQRVFSKYVKVFRGVILLHS